MVMNMFWVFGLFFKTIALQQSNFTKAFPGVRLADDRVFRDICCCSTTECYTEPGSFLYWKLVVNTLMQKYGTSNRTFTHFMLFCMFLDSLISIKNKHEKYWNLKELCGMLGNVLNHFVAVCVTSVCQLQQMIKKKERKKPH